MLQNQSGKKEDRLSICVTGDGISKLLAVPSLPSGTAALESAAVKNVIYEWGIAPQICAMSFDTTAVNSGVHNGVIVQLPKLLGKPLLALACRHHVAELVLKHCFELEGDNSKSNNLDGFKNFRTAFNENEYALTDPNIRTVLDEPRLKKMSKPWRDGVIKFCQEKLETKHPRRDYRELLELVVIFLGGVPPGDVKLRKAGSISRARWMSRAIYVMKAWITNPSFDSFSTELMQHFENLCLFITKCYVRYWYSLNDAVRNYFIILFNK